jgi:hypothetical protein
LKLTVGGFGLKTTVMEEVQLLTSHCQSKNHTKSSSLDQHRVRGRVRETLSLLVRGYTMTNCKPRLKAKNLVNYGIEIISFSVIVGQIRQQYIDDTAHSIRNILPCHPAIVILVIAVIPFCSTTAITNNYFLL